MKKFFVIFVALIGFGISAYADGGKTCSVPGGGYVTAWVDDNGIVQVANNTSQIVTVTVTFETCNGGADTKVVSQIKPNETTIGATTCKGKYVIKVENPICTPNK